MNGNSFCPGFTCPVCVVRFPFAETLESHWRAFHNRYYNNDRRSFPSIRHAAKKSEQNATNKKRVYHDFKTRTVNKHIPQVCEFCRQIIWNCAKYCTGCGFVCHVECQPMVIKHCVVMDQDNKSLSDESFTEVLDSETLSMSNITPPTRCSSPHSPDSELDLTYITDRLIALTFPVSGLESVYKSNLLSVLRMLHTKHSENYKIVNVSERRYDILKLNPQGQVLDYGWPDHLAPPISRLIRIVEAIHSWLHSNQKHVAVIHCKGGKSRIGVVIAAYIQFSKNSPSAQGALDWFALRRFYDTKLHASILPSQKRYVHYFGRIFEKDLKITNRVLFFDTIIMHGIPLFNNGSTFRFCVKVYEGYNLKHTTPTSSVSPYSKRFCLSIHNIQIKGDVMIKCTQKDTAVNNNIFRLQFHTDAIDGCVSVYGKYDLDEANNDSRFLDSCYIEMVFSPTQQESTDNREPTVMTSSHACTAKLDALIDDMLSSIPADIQGKMDALQQRSSLLNVERENHGHIHGPLNGNPYARITPLLKERLRGKSCAATDESLARGIEDLDSLLGDLDENANIVSQRREVKRAPHVMRGHLTLQNRSVLHTPPVVTKKQSISDDVFTDDLKSPTLNELLYELSRPPVNEHPQAAKRPNMSTYDNDRRATSGSSHTEESICDGNSCIPASGTVARCVRNLNNVVVVENPYNLRMGVPLAGYVSPDVVVEKISQYNRANTTHYDENSTRNNSCDGYSTSNANTSFNDVRRATDYETSGSGDVRLRREMDDTAKSDIFPCSDSAYGESMRSSSSSPIMSPISHEEDALALGSFDDPFTNVFDENNDSWCARNELSYGRYTTPSTQSSVLSSTKCSTKLNNYHSDDDTTKRNGTARQNSVAVVEEPIRPAHVQREFESLNNDIFKHLFEFKSDDDTVTSYNGSVTSSTCNGTSLDGGSDGKRNGKYDGSTTSQPSPTPLFPYQCGNGWPHVAEQPPYRRSRSADEFSDGSLSPRSPGRGRFNTMRNRRYRGSGSSSPISTANLFVEVARYPSIKFEKDTKGLWYKPNISREEAANSLRDMAPGSFVVRDSQSYSDAFGLAVKVEMPPIDVMLKAGVDINEVDMSGELVRHFLIEPCKKGVRLKGNNNEPAFPSLSALIYQHTLTKMALPIALVIQERDAADSHKGSSILTESQLLVKGAACNLVYLGVVPVESLAGDGAVQYALNKITGVNAKLKSTVVNIKVNLQGVTFTDNQRKVFFRRHFPMKNVLHCGVDPKGRKISVKSIIPNCDKEVGCFGIVVRKPTKVLMNECHVCAEIDVEQPTTAVINFIHKAMRFANV